MYLLLYGSVDQYIFIYRCYRAVQWHYIDIPLNSPIIRPSVVWFILVLFHKQPSIVNNAVCKIHILNLVLHIQGLKQVSII